MKRAIVVLLLILPVLARAQRQTPSAPAGTFRLTSVHVTGSKHFPEADLIAATSLKAGESIKPEQLKSIADALAATGAFDRVNYKFGPAGSGMTVQFMVTDAPEFLSTDFDNFVWFTRQQLMDAIRARVPLFRGEVPSQGEMTNQVADALQALLATRGIPGQVRFQIQAEQADKPGTGVFSVEGVSIRISNVTFPGASPADVSALEVASQKLLQMPYDRSMAISYVQSKLRPVYLERGYLKVAFGEPVAALASQNAAAPSVSLAIPVTPGPQYRLGAVRWSGNNAFQSLDLLKEIKLKLSEPANLVELRRDLETVHSLYAARGYLRQTTEDIPTLDDSAGVASFELRVSEGDQYRFASLELSGLEPQVHDLVREEWKLREGEPYNPGYIRTFLDAAIPLMRKGAVTQVQQDINDAAKRVEVSIHFDFQEPIKEPPSPATPPSKPAGRKASR